MMGSKKLATIINEVWNKRGWFSGGKLVKIKIKETTEFNMIESLSQGKLLV